MIAVDRNSVLVDAVPGFIDRWSLYTLAELQSRLKLGKQALRTARKEGLPIRKVGSRRFVLGSDAVEWMSSMPVSPN